jgi:hypothetical protein
MTNKKKWQNLNIKKEQFEISLKVIREINTKLVLANGGTSRVNNFVKLLKKKEIFFINLQMMMDELDFFLEKY